MENHASESNKKELKENQLGTNQEWVLWLRKQHDTETMQEKQTRFALMLSHLIQHEINEGWEVTMGEVYRPPETAKLFAKQGKGISNSLHTSRLAVDLMLFKKGKYLTRTSEYEFLGIWWESIGGTWGGRFGDGNHFSLAHGGRA